MDAEKKLSCLRSLMKKNNIDACVITKFDPHQSEYAEPYWNGVKFISGFTGSAGTVVVTETHAGLWTDGRYYLQAERELAGSEFTLHRAADANVKDFLDFTADETKPCNTIGFDGRTMSLAQVKSLIEKTKSKNISLISDLDLIGEFREGDPLSGDAAIFAHELKFCGVSAGDKLKIIRGKIGDKVYIISSLDDIAWLTNLRGERSQNCLFPAYMAVDADEAVLFTDPRRLGNIPPDEAFGIKGYDEICEYIKNIPADKKIILCPKKTSYELSRAAGEREIEEIQTDHTSSLKAVKNETEIANCKLANVRDCVSLTRFIKWMKENAGKITEFAAALKLSEFREKNEFFLCESFPPIVAYMQNAAIVHYNTYENGETVIGPHGFLLVDSGGQYLDGTTDITRTISLGNLTDEMKKNYTLVLKGHIGLARSIFPSGVTGHRLETIARAPLWREGLDYNHGTGHGIGFCLSVHEGPHSIAAKPNETELTEGMLVSNEPGLYFDGSYGIRTENTLLVAAHSETSSGKFLNFETITFAPFDPDAIDIDLLTSDELDWLNGYNECVFRKLNPFMTPAESAWLKNETRLLG